MGKAYEIIAGSVTNSAAGTTLTMAPGDSGSVRSFPNTVSAYLETVVRKGATAGFVRVRSPLLHDNVQGLRWQADANPRGFMLGEAVRQQLYSQDALILEANSGAADSTACAFGIRYDDCPGLNQRLAMWGDVRNNIDQIKAVEVDLNAAAALGQWSTTVLTATQDLLRANRDYAVLGYETDTACAAVALVGTDTSNIRIGGPGLVDNFDSSEYFVDLSNALGLPMIPVINSANKGTTNVSHVDNVAGTTPKVTLILALLAAPF